MRLKSIKLAGFKSFVDPTTVSFKSNMTAVVGPNGCGKSNIIDAVRWVMGESSAKNLRGESMTDVIFNGSSGRQPVGQASIELLFENNDGKLTGELAGFSEISIKRKVTREGISQYYLNGSKCRRRDVTDIFLGTGMGPRSYAIIEQGMISKLIESKPEDLRVFLEEAAGISKYKERRRETENRMRRTQENLERLADIREELGKQLQHLKRQANAAERYADFKKDERFQSAKLNALNWQKLDLELQQKSEFVKKYECEIESTLFAKTNNENKITLYRTQVEERQALLQSAQAKFYQSGAEISALEQQLKFQKNKQIEQEQKLTKLQNELVEIDQTLALDVEQQEIVEFELENTLIELEETEAKLEAAGYELESKELSMQAWQKEWAEFNEVNASTKQEVELKQNKIHTYEQRVTELDSRNDRLSEEKCLLIEQLAELDVDHWVNEMQIIEEQALSLQQDISKQVPVILDAKQEIEQLNSSKAEIYRHLSEKKAVQASLTTLQNAALGDNVEQEEKWLQTQGVFDPVRLMDQLSVSPGWESAAEQVLEVWLKAVFIKSHSANEFDCAAFSELSQSLVLIESKSDVDNLIKKQGTLAEHIRGVEILTPLLNKIRIATSTQDAYEMRHTLEADQSCITQDHVWLGKHWSRIYCPTKGQGGVVLRAKQISALKNEIPQLEFDISKKERAISVLKVALNEAERDLTELESQSKKIAQAQSKLASQLSANKAKYDQIEIRIKKHDEDLSEISLSSEYEQIQLEETKEAWLLAKEKLDNLTEEKESFLGRKEMLDSNLDAYRQQLKDTQNLLHQSQLKRQHNLNQKQMLSQNVGRLSNESNSHKNQISDIQSSDSMDDEAVDNLKLTLEGLLETRLVAEDKLTVAKNSVDEVSAGLRQEETNRSEFDLSIQTSRNALESVRMDTQALEINKRNLLERIEQDDFEIDALLAQLSSIDTESYLKNLIRELEVKIQRLGSINLAAIEEFKTQNERKQGLDAQNDELMDALEILLSAIKKIDKETRIRFKETYDQVNEGLQRLFPKIFGGGCAFLELTDDNLLETGVVIVARPPGKKNSTIHLLSGGEKSLTAIALIFAIFELNPAPFCMLDEVDAPLDDANVGRFANMVKEMSSSVQFIYISHNKVSMEKADQLMGVTMHEPGVSRLVSVDIEEASALVES